MKVVWANWKLALLRGRGLRWWQVGLLLILALVMVPLVFSRDSEALLFFSLYLVCLQPFSHVHCDIAAKPFSFCLPGYRAALRRMVLTDAMLGGLVVGALGVVLPDEPVWPLACLYAFSGFVLAFAIFGLFATGGLLSYVLGPVLDVVTSVRFCILALIALGVAAACPWLIWPAGLAVCVAVSVFVWVRLRDEQDLAHAHRAMVDRVRKKRARLGAAPASSRWVDELFLGQMMGSRFLGLGRCIWGDLYRVFAPFVIHWRRLAIILFVSALLLGYVGGWVRTFAFLAMSLFALCISLPTRSDMLLPAGRRERFGSAVAMAVVTSLLLVAYALVLVGLSWPLAVFIPGIPLPHGRLDYMPAKWGNIWVACLLVPWLSAAQLLERTRPWATGLLISVVVAVPIGAVLTSTWDFLVETPRVSEGVFAAVLLGGWAIFIEVLRFVCAQDCLTGPSV